MRAPRFCVLQRIRFVSNYSNIVLPAKNSRLIQLKTNKDRGRFFLRTTLVQYVIAHVLVLQRLRTFGMVRRRP